METKYRDSRASAESSELKYVGEKNPKFRVGLEIGEIRYSGCTLNVSGDS